VSQVSGVRPRRHVVPCENLCFEFCSNRFAPETSTTAGIFRSEPAFLYEISGLAESLQFRRFS
jgi:hypothetical protein